MIVHGCRIPFIRPAVFLAILLAACRKPDDSAGMRPYGTWESRGERLRPTVLPGEPERTLAADEFPVAGIVSHHLLAHKWIDAWFGVLSAARRVDTFIVLSPDHYGVSRGGASFSLRSWATESGVVRADRPLAVRLARAIGSDFDEPAFIREHGISVLVPYIARYFPKAEIVPVILPVDPPENVILSRSLAAVLTAEYKDAGLGRAFLIVSSDFSHHVTREVAVRADERSERFVRKPSAGSWFFAGCDNRPGMYILGVLSDALDAEGRILWNTNAKDIAPGIVNPQDVTSYFFSFAVVRTPASLR